MKFGLIVVFFDHQIDHAKDHLLGEGCLMIKR